MLLEVMPAIYAKKQRPKTRKTNVTEQPTMKYTKI